MTKQGIYFQNNFTIGNTEQSKSNLGDRDHSALQKMDRLNKNPISKIWKVKNVSLLVIAYNFCIIEL